MNWKIKAVGKGFYKTTGPSRCRLWPWLWLRLRCWQWLWVKIIMSRAIKREPKSPICVVRIGIKSWLNYLEKLSFFGCWKSLSTASKCRKTHPCDYRIEKFSRGPCPRTPLGGKAIWALPILCPGVKLSCPPVQNLNEPPDAWYGHKGPTVEFKVHCNHVNANASDARTIFVWFEKTNKIQVYM